MPGLASLTHPVYGYATFHAYAKGDTAVTIEAEAARRAVGAVVQQIEASHALFGAKAEAVSRLLEVAAECGQSDWDGYGAEPIQPTAVWNARNFLTSLPEGIPMPEIGAEPDGSVSLDWHPDENRIVSLSIGTSRLAYAWLDNSDKGHGVSTFDSLETPPRILERVQHILADG